MKLLEENIAEKLLENVFFFFKSHLKHKQQHQKQTVELYQTKIFCPAK